MLVFTNHSCAINLTNIDLTTDNSTRDVADITCFADNSLYITKK